MRREKTFLAGSQTYLYGPWPPHNTRGPDPFCMCDGTLDRQAPAKDRHMAARRANDLAGERTRQIPSSDTESRFWASQRTRTHDGLW